MPNIPTDQLDIARETIEQAKSVLVVLPHTPSVDITAAGLSLYLSLTSQGKQVTIYSPSHMTVGYSHLVGVDKIKDSIGSGGGKNLVISFPYQEGSIEKVSYNIEQDTFNLVIEPREGYPMITSDSIRFAYDGGGDTEMIVSIGISTFTELEQILQTQSELAQTKPILCVNADSLHTPYGKADITDPSASGQCELMTDFLSSLSLRIDPDIATNLLAGVMHASENFSSPQTTAQTFETAATLSRIGARKIPAQRPMQEAPRESAAPFPPPVRQAQNGQSPRPQPSPSPFPPRQQRPPQQQPSVRPMPQQQKQRPFPPVQPNTQTQATPFPPRQQRPAQQTPPPPMPQDAPADWLKPKIYKGSSIS